jgi:hypothetical protein
MTISDFRFPLAIASLLFSLQQFAVIVAVDHFREGVG